MSQLVFDTSYLIVDISFLGIITYAFLKFVRWISVHDQE
jgi:hypothetical protein